MTYQNHHLINFSSIHPTSLLFSGVSLSVRNIIYFFLFWTGVFCLTIASHFFTALFRENPFYWREVVPFAASWYLWFFLTFPVLHLAVRFPVSRANKNILWLHLGVFLTVNLVHIIASAQLISSLLSWLNGGSYRNILQKTAISGSFYNLLIYSIIVALVNSFHAYKELQKEKNKSVKLEKALITSRMHFLKQQLQPHFLFNTHHSIITLMKLGEKDKAIEMMEKLSDLMRFALRENNTQEITLEKELALLELYLDIQKTRFEDKLMVTFDVPKELLAASVPSMMLQPIVENSIKYAVEKSSAGSTIHIRARRISDMLELTVKDRSKELSHSTDIQKGIGLNNTEERLERLYEKQHHFNIRLYDEEEYRGSVVTIQIPLHYA